MRRALAALVGIAIGLAVTETAQAAPSALSSDAAAAGTAYGGSASSGGRLTGTSISLLRRLDGRVAARVGLGFSCRAGRYTNVVVRLAGPPSGPAFSASGSTRLTRRGRLHVRLTGSFEGETATGIVKVRTSRIRRCRGYSRPFALRTERVPAGGPVMPAAEALLYGVTGQAAGGIRLPIALHVTSGGRKVVAIWQATMRCGPRAVLTAVNFTPITTIRGDGTFRRSERYTIRYGDGMIERFRVNLRGRFLADGAVGTLRARMRIRKPGRRYYPCDSATQRWTATG